MSVNKPEKFGKYFLLDPIATGGMAELHRAKITGEEGFEKVIAVKKILPHLVKEEKLVKAFIDEARLAAFLQHENIVRIFDFGKMENDYFIAMEYLNGKNLQLLIKNSQKKGLPLGKENILHIISCICNGLHYAHTQKNFKGEPLNIIHRDISPPNIFISYEGEVKIIDFGVAKAASQNTSTRMGVIKGKVGYMSPEQAEGKKLDSRSDIFAIGSIFYELLVGIPLYQGDTMQVLAKARDAYFQPPEKIIPDLEPDLLKILLRSLAKNPDQRYQSCGQMLADIEKFVSEAFLRPTIWSLARYMKNLFDKEMANEEMVMQDVLELAGNGGFNTFNTSSTEPDEYEDTLTLDKPKGPPVNKKICIVGDLASGKTSIARRFVNNVCPEKYCFTMGVNVNKKLISFKNRKINLEIWDFCGQDHVVKISPDCLKDADGYFLVIDSSRASSYNMAILIQEKLKKNRIKAPFVCLLNKFDLSRSKQGRLAKSSLDAIQLKGWSIMKTSAKTGMGINSAFTALIEKFFL